MIRCYSEGTQQRNKHRVFFEILRHNPNQTDCENEMYLILDIKTKRKKKERSTTHWLPNKD